MKQVTLTDIARCCGLASGTVSMALRGDPRIRPETAERVKAAAARLGYDPAAHQAARRLGLRRHGRGAPTWVVGVCAFRSALTTEYFRRMLAAAFEVLTDAGYALLLLSDHPPRTTAGEDPPRHYDPLARDEVDGLLVVGVQTTLEVVSAVRSRAGFGARPAVVLIHPFPGCSSIRTDDGLGSSEAVRALLELGHRSFLRLGCSWTGEGDIAGTAVRRTSVEHALAAAGVDPGKTCRAYTVASGNWMDPAVARARLAAADNDVHEEGLVTYLRAHPDITAILAGNDAVALHAYAALRRAGIRVPEDVSIVGFDDTDPLPGPDGANLLSSIHLPLAEVGAEGARVLLAAIADPACAPVERILPAHFVARATVGPAPRGSATAGRSLRTSRQPPAVRP